MSTIDRRTLLRVMGAASVTPLIGGSGMLERTLGAPPKIVVARPGENRYPYTNAQQADRSPCKLTSADSAGALSMFELKVPSRTGPARHVHHREDEWCYVVEGEFLFEAGDEKTTLPAGGSIWMPRGIPHVWANTSQTNGRLIVACRPGGFEKFFDELGRIPEANVSPATVKKVMAKYGMDYLGPPLFGLWRQPSK